MRAFRFLSALAFLLISSATEEEKFPNPCKGTHPLPYPKMHFRTAADIGDVQSSAKFALLAVSTPFAYDLPIKPLSTRYVLFD